MARTMQHHEYTEQPTRAALLRWSSVFGGVVIGGALLLLLSTLWLALAEASGIEGIGDNLGWFIAASAIVALFVGGWVAGALSGVPGAGPGVMNGLTVWGVILVLSAAAGTPGLLGAMTVPGIELPTLEPGQALWPAFWSLLVGALTAGIGGALGGLMTRGAPAPVGLHVEQRGRRDYGEGYDERERRGQDDRDYDDRDYGERGQYADRREYGNGHDRERVDEGRPYEGDLEERRYGEERAGEPLTPSERAYAERRRTRPSDERGA